MNYRIRKLALRTVPMPIGFTDIYADYVGQDASDVIREELEKKDKPSLICKIGYTELNCLLACSNLVLSNFSPTKLILRTLTNAKEKIAVKSGFFPNDDENIKRFSKLLLDDLQQIDLLGTWMKHEKFIKGYIVQAKKIKASDMEPFFHSRPWTGLLANKTVLVIHPFEKTIQCQYKKREELFSNKDILPQFKLKTIRAVQSRENNTVGFSSWWKALEYLQRKIDEIDFDIAILGCGSYSLPLAAYIKRKGKKAIHLGGATQLLFGIKGSRWEEREKYRRLFNSSWVKPLADDIPANITKTDSYW